MPKCKMTNHVIGNLSLITSAAVAGSRAGKDAVIDDGNKLKVQLEAHQTIEHLKGLIANATDGVELPFELQKHGEKESSAYDNDVTLKECGLVSGSVVCIPAELLEIHFVLPRGLCRLFAGNMTSKTTQEFCMF